MVIPAKLASAKYMAFCFLFCLSFVLVFHFFCIFLILYNCLFYWSTDMAVLT